METGAAAEGAPERAGLGLRLVSLGAVAFAVLSAAYAARVQGETYDESDHLAWARRLLETGETERASFLRFNSKTPVLLPNVALRQTARWTLGVKDPELLRFVARMPGLLWLGLLLGAVFLAARAAFGPVAAHVATLMAALDPSLIAHASLAGPDVAYALATLLTLLAGWRFALRTTFGRAVVWGAALGVAFAVKFTAPLLVVGLPLLLLVRRPEHWSGRAALGIALRLAAAAATAAVVICAAYLGSGVFVPLSEVTWKSGLMRRLAESLPGLALPLPIDFLTGLDILVGSERGKAWNVVIVGGLFPNGVWFYFLLLWLVKTPILMLIGEAYGLVQLARTRRVLQPLPRYLAAQLALHLLYLSLVFRTQVGYRYALMCVPLACILAAGGLAPVASRRRGRVLAGLALAVGLAENLAYLGNPLSFTNAAVWPKRQVFRLIADSNVDWGQNDEKVGGWIEQAGLTTHLDPPHIVPGHNTLSLNQLAGVAGFERHRWVRENLDPQGHFGHTHLWFEVTPEDYARFLGEARTYEQREEDRQVCASAAGGPLRDGADVGLSRPVTGQAALFCLSAETPAEVAIEARTGAAVFARAGLPARGGETVYAGQRLVYRLRPGVHALLVVNAREFSGAFRVSMGSVNLATRVVEVDPRSIPRVLTSAEQAPAAR